MKQRRPAWLRLAVVALFLTPGCNVSTLLGEDASGDTGPIDHAGSSGSVNTAGTMTTSGGAAGRGGASNEQAGGPDDGVDAISGAGGEPAEMRPEEQDVPEVNCTTPGDELSECLNCGTPVTLGDRVVCDCPSGTWGERCEILSKQVAVALFQTCVLKTDGSVGCSGIQWSSPPAGVRFKSIAAGGDHICGIDEEDELHCWGDRHSAAPGPVSYTPPLGKFSAVDINDSSVACGLGLDGIAQCWGAAALELDGEYQQLACGVDMLCGLTPQGRLECSASEAYEPPVRGTFSSISVGWSHGCALRSDKKVRCWIRKIFEGAPAALPPPDHFQSIDVTDGTSCGVRVDGSVACWSNLPAITPPTGVYQSVAGRDLNFCGIQVGGSLSCWGAFDSVLPPPGSFIDVAPGLTHTCGVRADGTLSCWGTNDDGEGEPPAGSFQRVVSGVRFSCALTQAGSIECWGANELGQTQTPSGAFVDLALGNSHGCAVATSGALSCWGTSDPGEGYVGDELTTPPDGSFVRVFASPYHNCAQRADDTVACWGPALLVHHGEDQVPPTTKLSHLALAIGLTCGISPAGAIQCWGFNGTGLTESKSGPFTKVLAGSDYACGLRTNGRFECWGGLNRPQQ